MRKLILGALLCGWMTGSSLAQGKIAVVDLSKLFDGYWKTKQAQAVLKERQADMEKELKNMLQDRTKAREEYDKIMASVEDSAISTEERDKRTKAAREKLNYLKSQEETMAQYDRQSKVTLNEQGSRMIENLVGEIRNIVSAKAKSGGFSLVIDSSAMSGTRTPVLLFSAGENDLTQEVLQQLNATAPAETPKSEEKKADKKDEKKK